MIIIKRLNKTASVDVNTIENDLNSLIAKYIKDACVEIGFEQSEDVNDIQQLIETSANLDISNIATTLANSITQWKQDTKENYM